MNSKKGLNVANDLLKDDLIGSKTFNEIRKQIDALLEKEIELEKNIIKKAIREKFDGNYELAHAYFQIQLAN